MNLLRALLTTMAMLFGAASANAQAVSGQGTWETTLQARDVGNTGTTNAFYDTTLGITWLRDANVNGLMDWNTAMSWASNLTVGGVGGWRLADSNELRDVRNVALGNVAFNFTNFQSGTLTNTGNFENFPISGIWTPQQTSMWGIYFGPESERETYFQQQPTSAYAVFGGPGFMGYYSKNAQFSAMAVHPGDVAPVPEPETYAMLLAGLGLVGAAVRLRRSRDASKGTRCES